MKTSRTVIYEINVELADLTLKIHKLENFLNLYRKKAEAIYDKVPERNEENPFTKEELNTDLGFGLTLRHLCMLTNQHKAMMQYKEALKDRLYDLRSQEKDAEEKVEVVKAPEPETPQDNIAEDARGAEKQPDKAQE